MWGGRKTAAVASKQLSGWLCSSAARQASLIHLLLLLPYFHIAPHNCYRYLIDPDFLSYKLSPKLSIMGHKSDQWASLHRASFSRVSNFQSLSSAFTYCNVFFLPRCTRASPLVEVILRASFPCKFAEVSELFTFRSIEEEKFCRETAMDPPQRTAGSPPMQHLPPTPPQGSSAIPLFSLFIGILCIVSRPFYLLLTDYLSSSVHQFWKKFSLRLVYSDGFNFLLLSNAFSFIRREINC